MMRSSLPTRKRSSSLPRHTNYSEHTHMSTAHRDRPYHHELVTMNGFQTSKKTVMEMIRTELSSHNLDVSSMVLERFSCMILDGDGSKENLRLMQTLFTQPMLLSNEDLGRVLRLNPLARKDTTNKSPGPRKHLFYIRSWKFTPLQLYKLAKTIQENGLRFSELDEWKFASFLAGSRELTVRYVGATTSYEGAFRRFSDDLNNKSESSLLGAFQSHLERTYPQVFHRAEIHIVSDISLERFGNERQIGSQLNADDTETVLIHLLGCHSLMNLQPGGNHIRYLPSGEDETIFRNLRTRYLKNFLSGCSVFPEEKWSCLTSRFTTVLAGTPGMSATSPLTGEPLRGVFKRQAKPYQYFGETVMTFLGEELTGAHFKARCSFLDGPSKSSRLVRNIVYRIKNTEQSNHFDNNPGPVQDVSKAFAFLNTMPLPKYSDEAASLNILTAYFQCTRPVIVVTFGKQAASAIISNLTSIDAKSRRVKPFFALGTCRLATHFYGPDENDTFIHIPLSHPAKHQYGSRSPVDLRFFYISIQFAFFVASCATKIIKAHSGTSQKPPRNALCMDILDYVESQLQSGIGSRFRTNMENAGKAAIAAMTSGKANAHPTADILDYSEIESRRWHGYQTEKAESYDSTPNIRGSRGRVVAYPQGLFIGLTAVFGKKNGIAILDENNFRRISSFGVAVGEAYSNERRRDLESIWTQARRELHWTIPHSEDRRGDWMEQFLPLQPGQPYLLRILSQLADCDYLQALICDSQRPPWYPLPSTEAPVKDNMCEAVIKCGFWVQKKITKNSTSLFPSRYLTAKEMQGHPIGVKDDGTFVLRWKHPGGSNKSLTLTARFAAPQSSRDSRALSFTEQGFDIVDASGSPLRSLSVWDRGASKASIPRTSFLSRPPGQLLVDLWVAVRQECGHVIDEKEAIQGKREWGVKGQKILSLKATKEQIAQQNCPPLVNDANFLLFTFLNERFPDGGIFRTASKEKILDSTEDLQAFVEFCQAPDYITHPYASEWIGSLERDIPLVAVLGKNIQLHRTCNTVRYNRWQPHLKKMVGEVRFEIGPKKGGHV